MAEWLDRDLAALFWGQAIQDQRHAFDVAEAVLVAAPDDIELVRAALLHDVGKRHVRIGSIGRSIATLLEMARIPLPERYRRYRQHGAIGAAELEASGVRGIAVEFARLHPAAAPPGIDEERWQVLLDADDE